MKRQFLLFLAVVLLLALLMHGFHQLPRWLEDYNRQAAPEDGALDLNES
jgi:succinate dehydrogenase hydrophobic anchor subunit